MKSDAKILLGVALSAAAVAGLVWWGHSRAPSPAGAAAQNVGPFPDLKVGTVVLVDTVKADLLFLADPTVLAVVDQILSDRFFVSVTLSGPGIPFFSGTIPRASILKIVAAPPPIVKV